jgi:hypothetical protein
MSIPKQDTEAGMVETTSPTGKHLTRYDPAHALSIVERIAEGELLRDITRRDAVPKTVTRTTFLKWVSTVPELAKAYEAAKVLSSLAFEEEAIDKARKTAQAPGSPQNVSAANLLVSQLRWSATRRNPTQYSDKGNLNIVVPINISTPLDLGSGVGGAETEMPDAFSFSVPAQIEEAEYTEITDPAEETEESVTKEKLRAIIDPARPVVGMSHQPLLRTEPKERGNPNWKPGMPRKRVLTPGWQKDKERAERRAEKEKKNANAD